MTKKEFLDLLERHRYHHMRKTYWFICVDLATAIIMHPSIFVNIYKASGIKAIVSSWVRRNRPTPDSIWAESPYYDPLGQSWWKPNRESLTLYNLERFLFVGFLINQLKQGKIDYPVFVNQ